jgi:PKD repeat protein
VKPRVSTAAIVILLLSFTILPVILSPGQITTVQPPGQTVVGFSAATVPSNRPFDYILIILMENKNFNQINGSASAPYLNQLAHNYSLATKYTACDHPSLPNYMCLTGANNYFTGTNCKPTGTCTTSNASIVDRVESAGLTWRAYMEDMPSPCFKSSLGNYTYLTNPFIFYNSIGNNATRCTSHVVPANSGGKGLPDDNLVKALGSTSTASNYMWLTPNLCNNMHNCSISRGDSYLSKIVPLILNSAIFKTQKAALFITFDEGYGRYPTDYVYTVWAGPAVKTQYKSSTQYSHYSLTSTIGAAWGLQPLTAKDRGSPSMLEFFPSPPPRPPRPPVPLIASFTVTTANPDTGSTVNFTASATGGIQPYNYTWSFGDGNKGTGQMIGYLYQVVGNYKASLTVTDRSRQTAETSQAISVDTDPNSSGLCQGCTSETFPRTIGLIISFAIGVVLPLAFSFVVSRRRGRITVIPQTERKTPPRTTSSSSSIGCRWRNSRCEASFFL